MKLNLETKELFTDDGLFLKSLHCPRNIKFSQLTKSKDNKFCCTTCNETIIPTAGMEEDELLKILKTNPHQCLKVNLNQSNLSIKRNE